MNTLLLDRNSISFIDLDAFLTLTQLKSISLASNRIESFDNRIFEENPQLTNVDLSVNKFLHLPNEPILKSKSLQVSAYESGDDIEAMYQLLLCVWIRNFFLCFAFFIASVVTLVGSVFSSSQLFPIHFLKCRHWTYTNRS